MENSYTEDDELVVLFEEMDEPVGATAVGEQTQTVNTIHAPIKNDINIYEKDRIELNYIDQASVILADSAIRKGKTPQTLREGRETIFSLSGRNRLLFYIIIFECLLIPALLIGVIESTMSLPINAKPNTKTIEGYKHTEKEAIIVETFASYILPKFETWNSYTFNKRSASILPYLDPEIRGIHEKERMILGQSVYNDKRRQIAEVLRIEHQGVINETIHKVAIFYRRISGRGEDDKFQTDGFYNRVKLLFIGEAPITDENKFGLVITAHQDIDAAWYIETFKEDPWAEEEGKDNKK